MSKRNWEPKKGETYYYVDMMNEVCEARLGDMPTFDELVLDYADPYPTREQAQFISDALKRSMSEARESLNIMVQMGDL